MHSCRFASHAYAAFTAPFCFAIFRGNTKLYNVAVSSAQLASFNCPAANISVGGNHTCRGSYVVKQDDIEAGTPLSIAAQAASTSLPAGSQPISGQSSVSMESYPELFMDILAAGCSHSLAGVHIFMPSRLQLAFTDQTTRLTCLVCLSALAAAPRCQRLRPLSYPCVSFL